MRFISSVMLKGTSSSEVLGSASISELSSSDNGFFSFFLHATAAWDEKYYRHILKSSHALELLRGFGSTAMWSPCVHCSKGFTHPVCWCSGRTEHFRHVLWVPLLSHVTQLGRDVDSPADVHVHLHGFFLDLGVEVGHLLNKDSSSVRKWGGNYWIMMLEKQDWQLQCHSICA